MYHSSGSDPFQSTAAPGHLGQQYSTGTAEAAGHDILGADAVLYRTDEGGRGGRAVRPDGEQDGGLLVRQPVVVLQLHPVLHQWLGS